MGQTAHAQAKNKYQFETLEIGETMFVPGKLTAIRTSASMWGTRYGIWLRVRAVQDGAMVERVESAPGWQRGTHAQKKIRSVMDQLHEQKDALRAISLLLIQVLTILKEREREV
jgi:hypothetical protein